MGDQSSVVSLQSSSSVVGPWPLVFGFISFVLTVCLLATSGVAQQKTLVLKGGKLLTVSHGVIENGVLVMSAGKITALGAAGSIATPKGAQVIDVTGMT